MSQFLPANRASCASEAGWNAPKAPSIDSNAQAYPAPTETGCFVPTGATAYGNFTLHLLYNPLLPASVSAKAAFAHRYKNTFLSSYNYHLRPSFTKAWDKLKES